MVTKLSRLPLFNTIGYAEKLNVTRSLRSPLSGYLGGKRSNGYFINQLEAEWCQAFGVKNSIACNSATSGLFAACLAADVEGHLVLTTPLTMSATATSAIRAGGRVEFVDIEPLRYSLDIDKVPDGHSKPKALIVANMFGHPAYLGKLRAWCDKNNVFLIEDNAQSPFAMENGKYAGTFGDVGVFSLNVHKHLQAGEGGIMTTDNDGIAQTLRDIINHGELSGGRIGLNLRMTEPVAAIACAQLRKAAGIIEGRRELAHHLNDIFSLVPWVHQSIEDQGCTHVYYLWSGTVKNSWRANVLTQTLQARGVPLLHRYSTPVSRVLDLGTFPIAEDINDRMVMFEVCAYSPTYAHLKTMRSIVEQVVEETSLSPSLLSSREGEREGA